MSKEWLKALKVKDLNLFQLLRVLSLEVVLANDLEVLLVQPAELEGAVCSGFVRAILVAFELHLEGLAGDDSFYEELIHFLE